MPRDRSQQNDMGELPMERGETYTDEMSMRAVVPVRRMPIVPGRFLGIIPGATDTPSKGPSVEGGSGS